MSRTPFTAALIIFAITIASVTLINNRGEPVVVATNLENLPMEINGYRGVEDSFPQSVYEELNADKHVYRHYILPDGRRIDLYIGYYGTAKGGRTGHNPYACLPGAGWGLVQSHEVALKPESYTKDVDVNYVLARKGENL